MLPEEWPIRPPAERGIIAPAASAGRDRLSTARQDFFLPSAHRLTEQERALMTAMLHRLIEEISAEIQLCLPQEWLPANEDLSDLIDRLTHSGLLDTDGFVDLLLRRADEERIFGFFNARPGQKPGSMIQPLVSGEDAEIAAAAMAVLIARGRRRDRFGQPIVELDDLSPTEARLVVHAVAVALCERKPVHVANSDAERELCKAAASLLKRHDSAKSLDLVTHALSTLLAERGRLDENWLRLAIDSAEISLLAHALAQLGDLQFTVAANEILSGEPRRIMLLLRVAGVSREVAGHLQAVLGDVLGFAGDFHALSLFASFSNDRVTSAGSWLGLDPQFKVALKALGHGHAPV